MVDANSTVPGGAEASYIFAVWNLVIRPPRAVYDASQLGPVEFEIGAGIRGHRRDVKLRTKRGLQLACSHFVPRPDRSKAKKREWQRTPVVIYLHGNASSRLEAGSLVAKLLERNISLFCFDWAGCGLSDGEYVSLGWHERDDLATVIAHLRESQFNGPIGVWGRSMGAVTALMHVESDPNLAAICLDSPFSSLRELIEEIAQSDRLFVPVPTWLVNGILAVIRSRVKVLADFDIEDLVPLNYGPKSKVPALFLHGLQDTFVLPRHSEKLYNNYGGDKEMMMFEGDHNTERTERVIDRGVGFLCRAFRKYEIELSVSQQLADVHFSVPAQDGQPHRIPHLPRASTQPKGKTTDENRSALGDITNAPDQGPGARANEAEAAIAKKTMSRASTDSVESTPSEGSSNRDASRRPPPRKFASSQGSKRTEQPVRGSSVERAKPAALELVQLPAQTAAAVAPDPKPLINKLYMSKSKAPGADGHAETPRGTPTSTPKSGDDSRRTRSKGPTDRSGSSFSFRIRALAARGGA